MKVRFLKKWNRFRKGDVESCTERLAFYLIDNGFAERVDE